MTQVRTTLDKVQMVADVIGLIPIIGMPAEIVSGLISLRKKDYVGFGLSMLGLIPFEGEVAVAVKLASAMSQGAQVGHAVRPQAARVRRAGREVVTRSGRTTTRAREAAPAYSIHPAFNSRPQYALAV